MMIIQEIENLLKHVGCGDLDNHGMCIECDKIRTLLRTLLEKEKKDEKN